MLSFILSSTADPPLWTWPQSDISVWIITVTYVFVKLMLFPKSSVNGVIWERELFQDQGNFAA